MFFKFKRRRQICTAATLEEAAEQWDAYRDALLINGGGASSAIGNGFTVYSDRAMTKPVGKISYNGRIWPA